LDRRYIVRAVGTSGAESHKWPISSRYSTQPASTESDSFRIPQTKVGPGQNTAPCWRLPVFGAPTGQEKGNLLPVDF